MSELNKHGEIPDLSLIDYTLWYTRIKNLCKMGKLEKGKNECPLIGNIRNGNAQK